MLQEHVTIVVGIPGYKGILLPPRHGPGEQRKDAGRHRDGRNRDMALLPAKILRCLPKAKLETLKAVANFRTAPVGIQFRQDGQVKRKDLAKRRWCDPSVMPACARPGLAAIAPRPGRARCEGVC